MLDKNEKKKILRELKEKEKIKFEKSLPMPRNSFQKLFNFLDEQLSTNDCTNTSVLTVSFLKQNNIPVEPILTWLEEHGGYCDCEILGNVEEFFDSFT